MTHRPILAAALLLIAFGILGTVTSILDHGFEPFTVVSLLVLALFAFGVIGALREPPQQ